MTRMRDLSAANATWTVTATSSADSSSSATVNLKGTVVLRLTMTMSVPTAITAVTADVMLVVTMISKRRASSARSMRTTTETQDVITMWTATLILPMQLNLLQMKSISVHMAWKDRKSTRLNSS